MRVTSDQENARTYTYRRLIMLVAVLTTVLFVLNLSHGLQTALESSLPTGLGLGLGGLIFVWFFQSMGKASVELDVRTNSQESSGTSSSTTDRE